MACYNSPPFFLFNRLFNKMETKTYKLKQFDKPELDGYERKPIRTIEVDEMEFKSIMSDQIQSKLHETVGEVPGEAKPSKDGDSSDAKKPDLVAAVIEKINAAETIEKVNEIAGDDSRVTVIKAKEAKLLELQKQ